MRCSIIILICLLATIPCSARIITVDNDGTADFNNIQSAINDSNDGDIIEVQPGTYTGNGNRDIDFLGKAITVRSIDTNDPCVVRLTIIDCENVFDHRGFYFHSGEGPESVLSGITVTNGNINSDGGGIYCRYSSPIITNCRIINNHAAWKGGGIFCRDGNPVISRCIVTNNTVHEDTNRTGKGAGIMVWSCSPTIENCVITDNSTIGRYGLGGGIHCRVKAKPTISNCLIVGNFSSSFGGGICNLSDTVFSIRNCTIVANNATSGAGGIDVYNAKIANCIVWGNSGSQIEGDNIEVKYSDVQGGFPGLGNINEYPKLDDNYNLLVTSPCIDTGEPNLIPRFKETDINGEPRIMNRRVDIGADEFTSIPTPFFQILPERFNFYTPDINGPNPTGQVLQIRNLGFGTLNWSISEDCSWLQADPNSGTFTDETEVLLSIDTKELSEGCYSCELTISDYNAGNSPKVVSVTLVIGRSLIALEPNEIEFVFVQNSSAPEDGRLTIINRGGNKLNWTVETSCNWLEVEPNEGATTPGESNEVILRIINIETFDVGQYVCWTTVSDPCAKNSPQTVKVTLFVDSQLLVPSRYGTIQSAIDAAINGDMIIVADGIYTGEGNRDIDFKGKAITVRSENGPESCIIDCEGTYSDNHRGFYFRSGEGSNSILDGFTITNAYIVVMCEAGAGIYIDNSSPTIRNCIIKGNVAELHPDSLCYCYGGGIYFNGTTLTMTNCIISDNSVGGWGLGGGICCMSGSSTTLRNCIISNNTATTSALGGGIYLNYYTNSLNMDNCTIAENTASSDGGGIYFEQYENPPRIIIRNSILWDNSPNQISTYGTYKGWVLYSDVQGGWPMPGGRLNMDENPLFANPENEDYHLRSEAGRWDPSQEEWVKDANTSPCIDSGDRAYDWTAELWPHGQQINMGAYGGTPQASMSLSDAGNIADLNNDDSVNYLDLMLFTDKWPYNKILLAEDLDRNGFVDFIDFAIFSYNWDWKQ